MGPDGVHLLQVLDVPHDDGAICRATVEFAPLDTESQNNPIVALQCLLALVSGTRVPHLDSLVRGATKEQVTHGIDTETPDRALMTHEGPFALEDLLRVIGS
jgi:hypothetical protein